MLQLTFSCKVLTNIDIWINRYFSGVKSENEENVLLLFEIEIKIEMLTKNSLKCFNFELNIEISSKYDYRFVKS